MQDEMKHSEARRQVRRSRGVLTSGGAEGTGSDGATLIGRIASEARRLVEAAQAARTDL